RPEERNQDMTAVERNDEEGTTAAEVIRELAFRATVPRELAPGHIYVRNTPAGAEVIDLLDRVSHLAEPLRKQGLVTLQDAPSFAAYVNRHKTAATVLYAQPLIGHVLAVLNDHQPSQNGSAGWGDFRAILSLATTPEWQHWTSQNGKLLGQIAFSEHIEKGVLEIVDPPAAAMLELAQHFEAHSKVSYKSVNVLKNGQRQFAYEEQIEAKAGQRGEVTIPREFELGIAPFEGGESYRLTAQLRYRLSSEGLTIGYSLVRPHEVVKAAFADVLTAIEAGTELVALRGTYR
ncbi:MAG TPA: DUF2303 family protein, partial [Chloroflexota bacterium]